MPIATDGSFFPDGRHLIVRDYSSATVYDWPSLQTVGSFDLPAQKQGEGIAVGPDDTLYLSSEGIHSPVVDDPDPGEDPAGDGRLVEPRRRRPVTSASDPSEPSDSASHDAWPWVVGGLFALGAGVVLVRALRPR